MLIVDRFEGDFVVVEVDGKEMINIPRREVSNEVKEGNFIKLEAGIYVVDHEETQKRQKEIEKIISELWSDNV